MSGPGPSRGVRLAGALDSAETQAAQALAVLRASTVPLDVEDAAQLPVGAADRALLALHEQHLGIPLEHTITCDGCGALTTMPLGSADVAPHHPRCAWTGPGSGVREPTLGDLVAADGDVERLLARCSVGTGGGYDHLAAVEGSLSGPLHVTCAECGRGLEVDVDVAHLVLRALQQLTAEIDLDVHALASTYGWPLDTIESLPDDRRRRLAALAGSAP